MLYTVGLHCVVRGVLVQDGSHLEVAGEGVDCVDDGEAVLALRQVVSKVL